MTLAANVGTVCAAKQCRKPIPWHLAYCSCGLPAEHPNSVSLFIRKPVLWFLTIMLFSSLMVRLEPLFVCFYIYWVLITAVFFAWPGRSVGRVFFFLSLIYAWISLARIYEGKEWSSFLSLFVVFSVIALILRKQVRGRLAAISLLGLTTLVILQHFFRIPTQPDLQQAFHAIISGSRGGTLTGILSLGLTRLWALLVFAIVEGIWECRVEISSISFKQLWEHWRERPQWPLPLRSEYASLTLSIPLARSLLHILRFFHIVIIGLANVGAGAFYYAVKGISICLELMVRLGWYFIRLTAWIATGSAVAVYSGSLELLYTTTLVAIYVVLPLATIMAEAATIKLVSQAFVGYIQHGGKSELLLCVGLLFALTVAVLIGGSLLMPPSYGFHWWRSRTLGSAGILFEELKATSDKSVESVGNFLEHFMANGILVTIFVCVIFFDLFGQVTHIGPFRFGFFGRLFSIMLVASVPLLQFLRKQKQPGI